MYDIICIFVKFPLKKDRKKYVWSKILSIDTETAFFLFASNWSHWCVDGPCYQWFYVIMSLCCLFILTPARHTRSPIIFKQHCLDSLVFIMMNKESSHSLTSLVLYCCCVYITMYCCSWNSSNVV